MPPLSHIVGLVTGGASGLGAATGSVLIRAGARVVVADLPQQHRQFQELENRVRGIQRQLQQQGPCISFVGTDETSEDQVNNALDVVEELYGEPVNAVINCAGIGIAKKTLSTSRESDSIGMRIPHSMQDFTKVLTINTIGTFNVARLAAHRMASRDADHNGLKGCIINTASIAAMDGQRGQVAYATSKAALVGMTLPMAPDLSSFFIRVMTIAPGLFETPLLENFPDHVKEELGKTVPLPSRLGYPEEYGNLVEAILLNPMLNGEVIRLDGALRMPQ